MKTHATTIGLSASLSLALLILAGCSGEDASPGGEDTGNGGAGVVDAHPTEGPHQGELIELGNEEYHAELIHDEIAGSITIYVLDSTAKESVAIEASEVTVNLSHDGEAEQFTLTANADTTDPAETSSRFESSDVHLAEDLESREATLVLTIKGKQYRGEIKHDHDEHEDH
ncbi:hypothetical protein [Adhaeretor mobilis]|uniref:Lipoprotein n=1 Tax=Adhaeretor mobilis TaxID=1930276 RepID=A0A517MTY8_9BACT|nr:hypothetical protein [Adhaeretor mobilis]QDS98345.1 hypothetical protein HG15A2_16180 [Adhaeretor mobilis]